MRELTLKQKNEMIDWMVVECQNKPWLNVAELIKGFDISRDISWSLTRINSIILSVFPDITYFTSLGRNLKSEERFVYLLLVKEFINN